MLTTNNKQWFDTAAVRALHGLSADAWNRYSAHGFKPYEAVYPGYKINMTDIQASLGLPQLKISIKALKSENKSGRNIKKLSLK